MRMQHTSWGYMGGTCMNAEEKDIMNGADACPDSEETADGSDKPVCCREGGAEGSPERRTERSEEARRKLIHRLNRIEGQIRGIRQMIENDAYCNDVLVQSAAAGAALSAFNRELIGAHLKGCVTRDIREGRDEVVDELLETLRKLMK